MSYLARSNGLLVYGGLVSLNAMAAVAEDPFQRKAMYFFLKENYRLFGDKRARSSRELI